MFFSKTAGHKWIDRGHLAAPDFELADFTRDGAWYELDLSGIIPKNAVAVDVRITCRETTADTQCLLSTDGAIGEYNTINAWTQSTTSYLCIMGLLTPTTDQKISYKFATGTWGFIECVIRGWWI